MIIGAHSIIYSKDAQADTAFLREVLKFPHVDAGGGWLIFGLPPAEVAVHSAEENDRHEFYLVCQDIAALIATLQQANIACSAVREERWGSLIHVSLPGGGKLGVYQPKHPRPGTSPLPAARPARAPRARRGAVKARAKTGKRKVFKAARRPRKKAARPK